LNACDAVSNNDEADRVVMITTESNGKREVRVNVSDNGTGIQPDIAERIFEPFVTTKQNGLGLGLSICRSIVSSHDGQLAARNNPQRGATFSLSLPVPAAGVTATPP
jgi:C4-dicarboxylate-specific signal transduction histidine kinase